MEGASGREYAALSVGFIALFGNAIVTGCVGDNPDRGDAPDSGAAGDGAATADASPPDASTDAAGPCNLDEPFGAPALVPNVNSANNEWSARLTADERTLFLTREGSDGEFATWSSARASRQALFGEPTLVPNIDVTGKLESAPSPNADGTVLYLQADRPESKGYDIFTAVRDAGATFGVLSLVAGVNSPSNEDSPYFRDGKALYFGSNRDGNINIYRAALAAGGGFEAPQPLLGEVNTDADESFPVPSADELTIFFARFPQGSPAKIWVAKRKTPDDPFDPPSLVAELNASSAPWDAPTWLSSDGCMIYLSSNRSVSGKLDIYRATRP